MTPRRAQPGGRNQIPRLVWSVSAVGVCVGALVMFMGFRSLNTVDEQYVRVRRTTAEAEVVVGRINAARDAAFETLAAELSEDDGDGAGGPASWDGLDAALQADLEAVLSASDGEGIGEELATRLRELFAALHELYGEVVTNHQQRLACGARFERAWEGFVAEFAGTKGVIDKAQGQSRLQMLSGLRGLASEDGRAWDELRAFVGRGDALRAMSEEFNDMSLLAERVRWAQSPEVLHSLRENSLRQTIDRLWWVWERLPVELRDETEAPIASLSRRLIGDASDGSADGLCELRVSQLLARAEAERLRGQFEELRAAFEESEQIVKASITDMMHRDAERAAAIFRRVWRDTLAVGTVLLTVFLALSSRIARLGRKTEDALRAKNCELERLTARLEGMATTDALTGLPNRVLFMERLGQAMKRAKRSPSRYAVLFFDFDRFKFVNDSLGHEVGDALLKDIARIFGEELRDADTVARFGGDEFVVLLSDLDDELGAHECAERLLERFAQPHLLGEHVVVSTASIGLVVGAPRYDSPSTVIRDADAAMYDAKANGKGRIALYDSRMHESAQRRLTIEQDLHRAVEAGQLHLAYQPIIDLPSGQIDGFEALLRWQHPELGEVPPSQFIPIAEDTGTIVGIGRWVLESACAQSAAWNAGRAARDRIAISVNVSKRQLSDPAFCEQAIDCLQRHRLQPGDIKLEVTESLIAYDPKVMVPRLQRLREAGIPIVMDDFGTGVSSLSVLHECPIDNLKIDRSFVLAMGGNRSLISVVASITALAESLGISTVAEGIEDPEVVGVLLAVGCRWGQGYHFGKPLPADQAARLLESDRAARTAA